MAENIYFKRQKFPAIREMRRLGQPTGWAKFASRHPTPQSEPDWGYW